MPLKFLKRLFVKSLFQLADKHGHFLLGRFIVDPVLQCHQFQEVPDQNEFRHRDFLLLRNPGQIIQVFRQTHLVVSEFPFLFKKGAS